MPQIKGSLALLTRTYVTKKVIQLTGSLILIKLLPDVAMFWESWWRLPGNKPGRIEVDDGNATVRAGGG
jgi:hypothetical protein